MQSNKKDVDMSKVTCQRCLQKGHWTYQCSGKQAYLSRPSRTQLMRGEEKKREEKKSQEFQQRFAPKVKAQREPSTSSSDEETSELQQRALVNAKQDNEATAAKRPLFPARPEEAHESEVKKQKLERSKSSSASRSGSSSSSRSSSRSRSRSSSSASGSSDSHSRSPSSSASSDEH